MTSSTRHRRISASLSKVLPVASLLIIHVPQMYPVRNPWDKTRDQSNPPTKTRCNALSETTFCSPRLQRDHVDMGGEGMQGLGLHSRGEKKSDQFFLVGWNTTQGSPCGGARVKNFIRKPGVAVDSSKMAQAQGFAIFSFISPALRMNLSYEWNGEDDKIRTRRGQRKRVKYAP